MTISSWVENGEHYAETPCGTTVRVVFSPKPLGFSGYSGSYDYTDRPKTPTIAIIDDIKVDFAIDSFLPGWGKRRRADTFDQSTAFRDQLRKGKELSKQARAIFLMNERPSADDSEIFIAVALKRKYLLLILTSPSRVAAWEQSLYGIGEGFIQCVPPTPGLGGFDPLDALADQGKDWIREAYEREFIVRYLFKKIDSPSLTKTANHGAQGGAGA